MTPMSCMPSQAQHGSSTVSTVDTAGDVVEWSLAPTAASHALQRVSCGAPAQGLDPADDLHQQHQHTGSEFLPLLLAPEDGETDAGAQQASSQVRVARCMPGLHGAAPALRQRTDLPVQAFFWAFCLHVAFLRHNVVPAARMKCCERLEATTQPIVPVRSRC